MDIENYGEAVELARIADPFRPAYTDLKDGNVYLITRAIKVMTTGRKHVIGVPISHLDRRLPICGYGRWVGDRRVVIVEEEEGYMRLEMEKEGEYVNTGFSVFVNKVKPPHGKR